MVKAIVDRLEVIEIEHQHRHRLVVLGLQRAQHVRVFKEAAPVEQPGQIIGARGVPSSEAQVVSRLANSLKFEVIVMRQTKKRAARRAFYNVQNVSD
jgi:hypothetical protein